MNEQFQQFWALYPRKTGKLAAWAEWQRMDKKFGISNGNFEMVIESLKKQNEIFSDKDKQFIPHPRTWLHQGRWMDEVEESVKQGTPEWIKKL